MSRFSLYLFKAPGRPIAELEKVIAKLPHGIDQSAMLRAIRTGDARMTLVAEGDNRAIIEVLHEALLQGDFEVMLLDESHALQEFSDRLIKPFRRFLPKAVSAPRPMEIPSKWQAAKSELTPGGRSLPRDLFESSSPPAASGLLGLLLPDLKKLALIALVVGIAVTPLFLLARYAQRNMPEILADAASRANSNAPASGAKSNEAASAETKHEADAEDAAQAITKARQLPRKLTPSLPAAADPIAGGASFGIGIAITFFINLFALRRRVTQAEASGASGKNVTKAALVALGAMIALVGIATVVFRILYPPMQLPSSMRMNRSAAASSGGSNGNGSSGASMNANLPKSSSNTESGEKDENKASDDDGRFARILEKMGGKQDQKPKKPFAAFMNGLRDEKAEPQPQGSQRLDMKTAGGSGQSGSASTSKGSGSGGTMPRSNGAKPEVALDQKDAKPANATKEHSEKRAGGNGGSLKKQRGGDPSKLVVSDNSRAPEKSSAGKSGAKSTGALRKQPADSPPAIETSITGAGERVNDPELSSSRMERDCLQSLRPPSVRDESAGAAPSLDSLELLLAARRERVAHDSIDVYEPAFDRVAIDEPEPMPVVIAPVVETPLPVPVAPSSIFIMFAAGLVLSLIVSLGIRRFVLRSA